MHPSPNEQDVSGQRIFPGIYNNPDKPAIGNRYQLAVDGEKVKRVNVLAPFWLGTWLVLQLNDANDFPGIADDQIGVSQLSVQAWRGHAGLDEHAARLGR